MNKKYIVRLSEEERQVCQDVVKKLKGTSQKVRRAQILLKASWCSSPRTPLAGYAHRISITFVFARSLQICSSRIAASARPSPHKRPAHSPQNATRGCSAFAAL